MAWFLVRQDTHGTRFGVAKYAAESEADEAMASFEAGYPHHQTYYVEHRPAPTDVAAVAIPFELRAGIAAELARLVSGEIPEMMVWVDSYGENGARLVEQPDVMWRHPESDAVAIDAGGWHIIVPLWTEDESPSDLYAEFMVDEEGSAVLRDVRVL